MEFRVLGPVEAVDGGRVVPVDAPKQRALLAVLLIHANEVVSNDRLLEAVWGEALPEAGVKTLRFHISKLRDTLDPDRAPGEEGVVATQAPGYVLRLDREQLDATRFEELTDEARRQDPAAAVELLSEALGLWRGPAFADFAYQEFAQGSIRRLDELRLGAVEDRLEALLELGRHHEIAGELEALTADHPLRERVWGLLMVALYRSGRQAEALRAYQDASRVLGDELGIEPSSDLRLLEERILLQDRDLLEAGAVRAVDSRVRGYELRGVIGEGAYGITHRAYQPAVGREVAIKAIRPELANQQEFVRRFEAEAQLVAQLEHPHIVPLFDYWREPDGAYLVMPYLRGGNLHEVVGDGAWEPERVAGILEQVGAALAHAHRRGVVHRDLHPGNVLLDEEGNAYLADFGIAVRQGDEVPSAVLSAGYTSPEQRIGEEATPRSDIFGLGVLTYQLLTGLAPPVEGHLPALRETRPELSDELEEVVGRATGVQPAQRFVAVDEFVTEFRRLAAPASVAAVIPEAKVRNPYKGLRAFHETDADDFFGREPLVNDLLDVATQHRLVGVVGPSGSGKSSLVRAGLVPALRGGRLPRSEEWLITDMFPGADPFDALETGLLAVAVQHLEGLAERIRGSPETLPGAVRELLPPDGELVLIVDQFEELFTLTADEPTRRAFMDGLIALATEPRCPARVIITLRADYYDRPLRYQLFGDLLAGALVSVTPPSEDGLAQAVTGPASRVGVGLDPGLEAEIVRDVSNQPGGLPLMEYALTELFERRDNHRLTKTAYHDSGGVLGALGRRAEQLYAQLDPAERAAARQLFLRLVTVDEQTADTRRRVTRSELAGLDIDSAALDQVINRYGEHRLLSFDREPETRSPTIEVAHEALLREWPQLREWINERREALILHRRFTTARAEWTGEDCDPGYLLTGSRLHQFETWATDTDISLTTGERDYLTVSRRQEDQEQARRSTRRRLIMAGFAAAAIIALVLAGVAQGQSSRRRDEAAVNRARELAAASIVNLDIDPELSIMLALEGIAATDEQQREAVEALHAALQTSRIRWTTRLAADLPMAQTIALAAGPGWVAASADGATIELHDAVNGDLIRTLQPADTVGGPHTMAGFPEIAVNPSTDEIAAVDRNGVLRVWDPASGQLVWSAEAGRAAEPGLAEYSNDGVWLVTITADPESRGSVVLWDAASGERLWAAEVSGTPPRSAAFDPAGDRLVVSSWFASALIMFDRATGSELQSVQTNFSIGSVAWHPNREAVYVSHPDGTISIRTADDFEQLDILKEHGAAPGPADFASDGATMATSSIGTTNIWDVAAGEVLLTLKGPQANGAVLSQDGRRAFTSGVGGAISGWDVTPEGAGERFAAHATGWIYGIDVSSDGSTLAAHTVEGGDFEPNGAGATVWDVANGRLLFRIEGLNNAAFGGIAFSPDGSRIAAQDWDEQAWVDLDADGVRDENELGGYGPIILWDADTGQPLLELEDSAGIDREVLSFSPDVTVLASGFVDWVADSPNSVSIFNTETGRLLHGLEHPDWATSGTAFSLDGSLLATTTCDVGFVSVWDWAEEELLFQVEQPGCNTQVALSPTEPLVVASGLDNVQPIVWDYETGQQRYSLTGANGTNGVDFSPDGRLIAMARDDGTLRIWDAADGRERLTIAGPSAGLGDVRFFPDGKHIAVGTMDGNIVVFTLDVDELIEIGRTRVTRTLTESECLTYHFDPCPSSG